jgi:hypothetical protein
MAGPVQRVAGGACRPDHGGGDNLTLNLTVRGQTSGGTAPVNAVRLVGCNTGRIVADFYGRASTGEVEFVTTACTNIEVTGYMYNSGTTDASKDVVDTVTGSTWFASVYDGAAGAQVSGGSAAAISIDDFTTGATVATADGTPTPTAATSSATRPTPRSMCPAPPTRLRPTRRATPTCRSALRSRRRPTMANGQTLFTVAGGPIKIEGAGLDLRHRQQRHGLDAAIQRHADDPARRRPSPVRRHRLPARWPVRR